MMAINRCTITNLNIVSQGVVMTRVQNASNGCHKRARVFLDATKNTSIITNDKEVVAVLFVRKVVCIYHWWQRRGGTAVWDSALSGGVRMISKLLKRVCVHSIVPRSHPAFRHLQYNSSSLSS